MGTRKKCIGLLAAALLCLSGRSASAAPLLNGSFTIMSFYNPVDSAGNVTNMLDATAIDFLGPWGIGNPTGSGWFTVVRGDGDFASLAGSSGSIKDFSFIGSGPNFPAPPISGFETLSVGSLSFALDTIGVADRSLSALHLTGTGWFTEDGYDPTQGNFGLFGSWTGVSIGVTSVPE